MVKLQVRGGSNNDGPANFFVTVPKRLVEAKGWKKDNEMSYMLVGTDIIPQAGDVILRRVG